MEADPTDPAAPEAAVLDGEVDPDDADASSGACGCILAAVALILLVGTLYACAARGPGSSTCESAWDDAATSGAGIVEAEPYRATLVTCTTVEEWDEQNIRRGARLPSGPATIAELCRTLDVTSSLCTLAAREAP